MDGIEVLAVVFYKKLGISVGTFVMVYNSILYIICGIVLVNWILPLYSIVTYMAGLKTVDFTVEGFDRSKAATIVTTKADEICACLSKTFECGITIYDAKGYFLNKEKKIVYIILNRFQIAKMKELVHQIDGEAFISITEIADVFTKNAK